MQFVLSIFLSFFNILISSIFIILIYYYNNIMGFQLSVINEQNTYDLPKLTH